MTSASAINASGNHHRHVCQKYAAPVGATELSMLKMSDVFVVRGIWVNELSFNRCIRSFNHFYAITLRIVLNFVHDVVDEEHSPARGSEQVGGVTRIRNLTNVEAFAFVFDCEGRFCRRQFGSDLQQLGGIVFVSMLDRVYKRFIESDEQIRLRAASAYHKYQNCGLKAANVLFATGW